MIHAYSEDVEVVRFTKPARERGRPKVLPRHHREGRWCIGLGGRRADTLPLYRQSEVLEGLAADDTIYIVEGESDADAIVAAGGLATTNIGGAGKFRGAHADRLAAVESGSMIRIIGDRDEPGEAHANGVHQKLLVAGIAAERIQILQACEGNDAADHLAAGHGLEDFELIRLGEVLSDRAHGHVSPEPTSTDEAIRATCAADVQTRPVQWLWRKRIPRAKVTVVDGPPGVGKTLLLISLAACITRGKPMPDGAAVDPGSVVFVGFEDDAADTIVPRLLAAGGDPRHFFLVDQVQGKEGPRSLELPEDVLRLETLVRQVDAHLLVIDPLMAALGADVRTGIDHHVRRALAPVRDLAERTGVAVVLVRHLNKNLKSSDPITRGGGSIGIIGAARAGLLVGRDPDNPSVRVLATTKTNLAAEQEGGSLAYRIFDDSKHHVARIEWLGASERNAQDLLLDSEPIARDALSEAVGILSELLAQGPVLAREAKQYLSEAGIAPRTLDRAKRQLGVLARPKVEDGRRAWWWSLPKRGGRDA